MKFFIELIAKMVAIALIVFVVAALCGCVEEPCLNEGPDQAVTWERTRVEYLGGVEQTSVLACDAPDAYPQLCPFLGATQRVTMALHDDGFHTVITWWDPSVDAQEQETQMLGFPLRNGCLWVDAASDGTGLRHAFTTCLDEESQQWRGVIEWTLRANAGRARLTFAIGEDCAEEKQLPLCESFGCTDETATCVTPDDCVCVPPGGEPVACEVL